MHPAWLRRSSVKYSLFSLFDSLPAARLDALGAGQLLAQDTRLTAYSGLYKIHRLSGRIPIPH